MNKSGIQIFKKRQRHLAITLCESIHLDFINSGGIDTEDINAKRLRLQQHEALIMDPGKFFPVTFYNLQN
jgi:predicted flavoprotein YhiN